VSVVVNGHTPDPPVGHVVRHTSPVRQKAVAERFVVDAFTTLKSPDVIVDDALMIKPCAVPFILFGVMNASVRFTADQGTAVAANAGRGRRSKRTMRDFFIVKYLINILINFNYY
jgi:hypothetical protein